MRTQAVEVEEPVDLAQHMAFGNIISAEPLKQLLLGLPPSKHRSTRLPNFIHVIRCIASVV